MKLQKSEFFYQVVALVLAFLVVHTIYIGLVRPNAEAVIEAERQALLEQEQSGEPVMFDRSAWVVLKDYEQEACFVLMLWAMAIMGLKAQNVSAQRRLLGQPLVNVEEGRKVLPEDARKLARPIEALPDPEVRGIGAALGNAHEAVAGNIAAVTSSLGVAFNSTFIALLISIVIMFLTHQITLMQERMVMEAHDYCDDKLIRHLQS